ncbi:MAG: antitoxin [Bryobacteraceae bacterium]
MMRTTLDLTEDAYQLAKAVARDRNDSLGRVVSELILKGAHGPGDRIGEMRIVDGWPVVSYGRMITSEDVKEFLA